MSCKHVQTDITRTDCIEGDFFFHLFLPFKIILHRNMTEFEVESMSDGSEPEDELDDSDLEVI